jgi:hypothetical protein
VFVLFKKDRLPFFELVTPTSEEAKNLKKPAPEKHAFAFTKLGLRENDKID